VYNKKIKSESNILNYSLFVSYFPLLVAGPIERAGNLLNQFKKKNNIFDYSSFVNGMQLILIGFFKKIVLADNLSLFVDDIYINSENYNGATLILGTFFFAFQIYFDFSGYSDIASGLAKLFGQKLIINFNYPYLSKNIIEFWQKWHISLSSFFKDYIYIPIGGNTNKNICYVRNILFIFLISGIWHGANLNFIIWGLYHGLLYLISKIIIKFIKFPINNNFLNGFAYLINFTLISIGWIFFRSDDFNQSFKILRNIFCSEIFDFPYFKNGSLSIPFIFLSLFFLLFENIAKTKKLDSPIFLIQKIKSTLTRNIVYYVIIFLILYLGNYQNNSFIYFQF
jgi:D-alanyl-lipoteichoic acid acyltransferase DltB (MBOAT superfamily)